VPEVSKRIGALEESGTVAISDRARQMQQEGIDVINLGGGDPDFVTPHHIVDAAFRAISEGQTHYVASKGVPGMRRAVAAKFRDENGIVYDPDREILVTASGKAALFMAIEAMLDPGDEMIVLEPAWVSYKPLISLVGATPVGVGLAPADSFRITREVLEKKVSRRTKAILVNSPNNPTGRVLSAEEAEVVRSFAVDRNLWVLSDEIYEKIRYDGRRHISLASLPGMRDRTATVNGMSKSHAMTGWRLGYLGAPADLYAQILKVQQHVLTCAASFVQFAGTAALEGPQDCIAGMVAEYDSRRRRIAGMLNRIPGFRCPEPEGAFYFFPEVEFRGMDSYGVATFLLEEAHVAVTPGEVFGASARKNIRLSFATSMENLENAAGRIADAIASA
jgi:aspartate aminotransferase